MADEDMLNMIPKTDDLIKNTPNGVVRLESFTAVIVESPYAGDIEKNEAYARGACKDCMRKGEIPFASHLFFPQFLDETSPVEREIGIQSGYFYWQHFSKVVFYIDNGISPGMVRALEQAILKKKPYEFRQLPKA